jgi:hypothetical protein
MSTASGKDFTAMNGLRAPNAENLRTLIAKARAPSPWDLSNEVLYSLCRNHPGHTDPNVVIAKLLIIGRVYATAIERRRSKYREDDDFYVKRVAPRICRSPIDAWLEEARCLGPASAQSFQCLVKIHDRTTQLFKEISGLEKRSLASKYLHFHVPELFFIYDSRASKGMSALGSIVARASKSVGTGDNDYRKFVEKCICLKNYCVRHFRVALSPRQLDTLLLAAQTNAKPNPSVERTQNRRRPSKRAAKVSGSWVERL